MSKLDNKKIIILGDRDGISAEIIKECMKNVASAQVIYSSSEFFTTAMDLDNQKRIKAIAEQYGLDNVLLIIGTGEKASTGLVTKTVTSGDPSGKGALADVALQLPILHVLEDDFMAAVDATTWEEHIRIFKTVHDYEAIIRELRN